MGDNIDRFDFDRWANDKLDAIERLQKQTRPHTSDKLYYLVIDELTYLKEKVFKM